MSAEIHVLFMRHGRSRGDDEAIHEGRYDAPLNETGQAQARTRALQWQAAGLYVDRIITSPLVRASETAQILSGVLRAPVEADEDWMEMDNGPLAGLPRKTATAQYPQPAFRNPYEPFHGTGESDWEIYCRAARAVENLVRRGVGQYVVVAHGGILNAALRTIVGAQPTVNGQGAWFAFGDTGFLHAVYYPENHRWVIREFAPGLPSEDQQI